ncbi:MAG: invasion associated locus B family protein, partial [Pseudolabrys sp.]
MLLLLNLSGRSLAATVSPIPDSPQPDASGHWIKSCSPKSTKAAPRICVVKEETIVESGTISAMLVETDSTAKKLLRVTLPLGMDLRQGASIIIDDRERISVPYVACENQGCVADFDASNLILLLKQGRKLAIQGTNGQGKFISYVLPLDDFAAAYD